MRDGEANFSAICGIDETFVDELCAYMINTVVVAVYKLCELFLNIFLNLLPIFL